MRTIEELLRDRGPARRRVPLAARERLERAHPRRRRGGRLRRGASTVSGTAEELGATQFEVLTAAALAEFADARVDVAVVEAGLGGRLDATNVVDAPGRAADERGARAHGGARRDDGGDRAGEARRCACSQGSCARTTAMRRSCRGRHGSSSAARARRRRRSSAGRSSTTSRSRCPAGSSGAATTSGTARTRRRPSTGCSRACRRTTTSSASRSCATRTPTGCWRASHALGTTLVATRSSNPRALPADELAGLARAVLPAASRPSTIRSGRSRAPTSSAGRCS